MITLPALSEREVTRQVIDFCKSERWLCIRLQSGTVRGVTQGTYMRLGQPGLPDWIIVRELEYCFVELKAPGKPLRPAQKQWFEFAAREGYPAIVADGLGSFLRQYRDRWPAAQAAREER